MTPQERDDHFQTGPAATLPALAFDPAKYAAEFDAFDLTEAQRLELLQTLWSIMRSFVELGFAVDVCGAVFGNGSPDVTGGGGVS